MANEKKKPVAKEEPNSLPKHDINNPLIVDLPDGQKLVIGELADGSIIEIATWRGTGRPDSRTSRLMLGMANGRAEQIENSKNPQSHGGEAKSSDDFLSQVKGSFAGLASRFTTSKEKKAAPAIYDEVASKLESDPVADELDQWLANILEKAEKNVARQAARKNAAKKKSSPAKKAAPAKKAKISAQTSKRAKKAAPSSSSTKKR